MSAPRILWASPFALHDTSSGAAVQTRTMLEQLVSRGMQVTALSCMIFDAPAGKALFKAYEDQIAESKDWFKLEDAGIAYSYMKVGDTRVSRLNDSEQRQFFAYYSNILNQFRPDLIIMYGGGCMEYALRAEAALRRIPSVYNLCNANHRGYGFPYVDTVIVDSQAMARFYQRENGMLVEPVGIFIRPERVVVPESSDLTREYVTFVNPTQAKGVSMVARLALMAQQAMPEVKFLVVQSRGRWQDVLSTLRDDENPDFRLTPDMFPNVFCTENQSDMRAVYAVSRAVLTPSLCFEGWGRVATESVMNGIPVVASPSGGLPEAVGEGGRIVPCPQSCYNTYSRLPTAEEVQPWLDALKDVLDPERADHWREATRNAAAQHHIERSTDRLVDVLSPLLARRDHCHPHFYMRGANLIR